MSKRFYYPEQQGERKKAKLDVSISDHNFPLSQNNELSRETEDNNWGDENDDEILLLASQACEEAYGNNDISHLPDYSMCMHPGSTSTQLNPQPSTSKSEFTFKKPSFNSPLAVSTHLKEKCNRISSPLPGITSKVISKTNEYNNSSKYCSYNDRVLQSHDTDYISKQLLQLQEENSKLKSENGKLLDKCVTKEGEASILRTQLKSCQSAVDNARLEKIKAQEKVQIEYNEKLTAANSQIHDLKTQLDFKNLEIISVKEKCKKLESTKVKLTQVTVGNNDISQRYNNNTILNDSSVSSNKRFKTTSSCVQTEDKIHFMKLYKRCSDGNESTNLNMILSYILEPSVNQQHSILDYHEKLQRSTDLSQNKCRIYSTFHRVPSTPVPKETRSKVVMRSVYEDITAVACGNCDRLEERYFNIFNCIKSILNETVLKLETVCQRVTTSFQKEMDEKYIEATSSYVHVSREELLKGRSLYKEEQDILSRRMVATLGYIVETSRGMDWFLKYEAGSPPHIIDIINRICTLLDNSSCASLYSGLLLSITTFSTFITSLNQAKVIDMIKTILISRPMPFVVTHSLYVVTQVSTWDAFKKAFCPENGSGNLKTDYDQGVLLYKKDSCYIQVLLKQVESCLKCIEKQQMVEKVVEVTQNLIILHSNLSDSGTLARENSRCDCQLVLVQVLVYALRICAVMLHSFRNSSIDVPEHSELVSACRCGAQAVCQHHVELGSLLAHCEGHLLHLCHLLADLPHTELYSNMLSELSGALLSSEDMPSSFHRQPWVNSFASFSLAD
ncbi:unnamed protein product [Arctia plantaginis]|uniref:ATR-interacting protein n=1 Tax=Arctia plantaginis TaxID=874455 RepID=A0A8S1ABD4_ARCPL|nr:unnamed protein product [Arctia plantaginis]